MKRNYLKIAALALLVTFSNCSKDEAEPVNVTPIAVVSDADMEKDILTDLGLDESYESIYTTFQNSLAGKGVDVSQISLKMTGTCDITPTTNGTDTYENTTYLSITYDYGTTGCTNEKGATIKGIIKLFYKPNMPIIFQFTDYEYNGKKLNGKISFLKEVVGTNQAKITNTQNLTANIPTLGDFNRTGTVVRTYTQGYETKDKYMDDIFEVTGSWTTTFPDKTTNVVTITEKLVSEIACPGKKRKQGKATVNRKGNTAIVDFGNGSCSAKWMVTRPNQTPFEIQK